METGILANGVSSRLDWNEFMARQTKFLQVHPSQHNPLHQCHTSALEVPGLLPTAVQGVDGCKAA